MKITRELLRQWGACYTDERIEALVPEDGLTPLEFAALDIPAEDRMWALLREEVIPARALRLLACDWAEKACRMACWNDERSMNAIAVARRYAVGEATEAERACAAAAAWAARSEAWASARSAWSARAAAAESSAWAAREAASSKASEWAVMSAAWSVADAAAAAWSSQLADVVRVLRESEGGTQE